MKLELDHVEARHAAAAPGQLALRDVSLRLAAGERLAVIGPSGAGKTSLLDVAGAALKPVGGRVLQDGVDPWSLGTHALQRQRGRLFIAPQTPPLPPRQRVVTAVLAGRLPAWSFATSVRSLFHPVDLEPARAALARFDLADKLFARVDRLSGGERQRVGLARALLAPASLWLVDEPLSGLDPSRAEQAIATLSAVARERGVGLIASLHQVDIALAHFERVVGMRDGRVAFDLPRAAVTHEHLARLYAQHEAQWLAPADALPPLPVEPPAALPTPMCR